MPFGLTARRRAKVFGIGMNKTGTTSLERAFHLLGFRIGDQDAGCRLIESWARRDFDPVIALCRTADAFQDIPFSLPFTYQAMDAAFPGSRFILTVRDSPEQWYQSLTRFHTVLLGKGRLPTAEYLKASKLLYPGWMWRALEVGFANMDPSDPYRRETLIGHYLSYNAGVREYFRHRPEDLLVLNCTEEAAMDTLCSFLGVERRGLSMPHIDSDAIARAVTGGPPIPSP